MHLAQQPAHSRREAHCVAHERETAKHEPIDRVRLFSRIEGDLDLLREIVSLFLADYPRRLGELKDAVTRGDSDAVSSVAHSIKGSVGSLAAQPCYEAAQRLERMGISGDLTAAGAACAALEAEVERLKTALRTFAPSVSPSSLQR
jgi:HPt (histidine-containing phosphotransfer) domain-containing protein